MIKSVIFDLDGTLLNTLIDLEESTNFSLSEFGYPKRSIMEIKNFVGDGVKKLIERAVPDGVSEESTKKCLEIFKQNYTQNMYNRTKPFDGIIELLENLKEKNIKIGVVSNKFDDAVQELCKKYFGNLIDYATGQSDKVEPKPDPTGLLKVIKKFKILKEEVFYVGDSFVDVETAQNAGVKCIGVTWGYRLKSDLEGADYIIDEPQEMLNFIK